MEDFDKVFENLKSLRSIALIEALASDTQHIDDTILQRIKIDKTFSEDIFKLFVPDLLVTNQLYKLKLLLKDAEIARLSGLIQDSGNTESYLIKSELPHINSMMNDIKLAVSSATTNISKNNEEATQTLGSHENNANMLSDETKEFIELKLEKIVRENFDSIVNSAFQEKKEKQSKVLDLSETYVSHQNKQN